MQLNTTLPSETPFMMYCLLRLVFPGMYVLISGRNLLTLCSNMLNPSTGWYQTMWHQNSQDHTVIPTRTSIISYL